MSVLVTVEDIGRLRETSQVECKLAQGRDGAGALPEDIWESYSAFANTDGGEILLGLKELGPGSYELAGIANPEKVIAELRAGLDNPRVVSVNLLGRESIRILELEGRYLIRIHVPMAPVALRPVHIGGDALSGSYVRHGDSDIRLAPDYVRRMQAKVRSQLLKNA